MFRKMNRMEHVLQSAIKSVRGAHQAELDMERQQQNQNRIVMQDQIKSLEENIGSLSTENRRLYCKNKSLESKITLLQKQNKKISKGKD